MPPNILHLPNGQNLTVVPVFGGLFFKSNELNLHNSVFPAGWTIVINSDDEDDLARREEEAKDAHSGNPSGIPHHIHRFKHPTLHHDNLFISSISNPSSNDFKPAASPTRQIAMMLWVTLYWYFHQTEPPLHLIMAASKSTPDEGKPKGEWRINIKREGIFRGRNLLAKLERMGLIASEDSSVGSNTDERSYDSWTEMFVSRRTFWQLSPKIFLFTLTPIAGASFPGSPYGSRPSSPVRGSEQHSQSSNHVDVKAMTSAGLWTPQTPGPFASGSHLPTYYPPPPTQYKMTNGVRHPIRPKPPRQGETFYMRHIPSVGQYLSFRVASLNDRPVAYTGPISGHPTGSLIQDPRLAIPHHIVSSSSADSMANPRLSSRSSTPPSLISDTAVMSDLQLLHKWMNVPRVAKFWGCSGPTNVQETFLKRNLENLHSFPVIACWDGKPFGYFEIYWVMEDGLGRYLSPGEAGDWDRGVHVLVGEEDYRGAHRVSCWITSLVHWAFSSDYRTSNFVLEPRVDNERFIKHLTNAGFSKEREIALPHKQSALMRLKRENFCAPVL